MGIGRKLIEYGIKNYSINRSEYYNVGKMLSEAGEYYDEVIKRIF